MFNLDQLARIASAAVFSVTLTTVAVGAAIGPIDPAAAAPTVYAAVQTVGQANG